MDNQVWTDDEFRRRAIYTASQNNTILHNALSTARVNGLSRLVAIECALLALCEENQRLFDHAVDAESRATPRQTMLPDPDRANSNMRVFSEGFGRRNG